MKLPLPFGFHEIDETDLYSVKVMINSRLTELLVDNNALNIPQVKIRIKPTTKVGRHYLVGTIDGYLAYTKFMKVYCHCREMFEIERFLAGCTEHHDRVKLMEEAIAALKKKALRIDNNLFEPKLVIEEKELPF